MKKIINKLQYLIAALALLFLLPGCLDIYFTTEIKPNGEIVKTIVFEGDSTEILDSYFPFMDNETWERKWIHIDEKKSKLILSKTFKNDKLASLDLNPEDSIPYVRFQPKLKKKFRWFYSYYEYSELLLATNPFDKLDWRDYLTEDEVALIPMDDDEREADPRYIESEYMTTEDRFEEFLLNSGFEEFIQLFNLAISKTDDIKLRVIDVNASKPELYKLAIDAKENDSFRAILQAFKTKFDSTDIDKIAEQNQDILDYFDKKIALFEEALDDNVHMTIKMPGLLIDTNSDKIEGNSLSWEIDFFDAYFEDYSMTAESRLVNTWAFVVTILAVAFLLFTLLWNIFRRKKS